MHEMHLLKDLMNDLLKIAEKENVSKIHKVYLKMGEYTEINPDILRFFFKENSKNTVLEDAEFEIEKSPTREIRVVSFDAD